MTTTADRTATGTTTAPVTPRSEIKGRTFVKWVTTFAGHAETV